MYLLNEAMTDTPHDTKKNIEDLLRQIIEAAGQDRPVLITLQIAIPPSGQENRKGAVEQEIEVQALGNHVTLVAEFPGMSPEDIHVRFDGDKVAIRAGNGTRQYRATATVPPAQEGSIGLSFRHGILEVTYTARALPPGSPAEPDHQL